MSMRTHGWGGATPASDEEAIDRILDAAGATRSGLRFIEQLGAHLAGITDQLMLASDFGSTSTKVTSIVMGSCSLSTVHVNASEPADLFGHDRTGSFLRADGRPRNVPVRGSARRKVAV